jgi:purine-nucleoside phosphorylase
MTESIPLLEFDSDRDAIIEPARVIKHRDLPERCVMSFFWEVVQGAREKLDLKPLRPLKSEMGEIPVFAGTFAGRPIGIVPAAGGAPLAAGFFEELIARGGRKFICCGCAGVLDKSIGSGDIIVPTSALRDEGTSYHYLPAGRDACPSAAAVEAIVRVLERHKCRHVKGRTWTTDAFYRETRSKVAKRREQGCMTVEMEAAALFAVGEFRQVQIAMLLYGGDDVSGIEWDPREFGQRISAREKLFWLSMEACAEM